MRDISLMYILNLALRRIWVLILAAIVFAAGAFCYCKFLATPEYTATASVLVTNGGIMVQNKENSKDTISTTDISASINLVDTVTDILETSDIYKQLAEKTDNKYTYKQLKSRTTISAKTDNSMFVDVSFSAADPTEAANMVNAFVELTPEYIVSFVPYSNVAVAATADSATLVFPSTAMIIVMAAVIGVAIAFVIVFIIDSFDQAILGEKDFTSHYDIPLIGSVPDFETMNIEASNYYQKGAGTNGY
ncbi:MAG: hypothetical protein E7561_02625 [Ruminococcaceae bacterium]|nr:hypothetical protein [Oscillospiraceae bacterium]